MRTLSVLLFLGFVSVAVFAQRTPVQPASQRTQPAQIAPGARVQPQPTQPRRQVQTSPARPKTQQPAATDRSAQNAGSNAAPRTGNTSGQGTAQNSPQNQAAQTTTARNAAATTPAPAPNLKTGAAQAPGQNAAAAEAAKPIGVQWLTFEEAVEKSKTEKRKIFVDVYTDWCGWCKRMDQTTFSDPAVVKYLNENYYAVKFNAEQQQDIAFKGKTYHFKKMGGRGYHELAAELLGNRMSYPTTVFLNEALETIQPLPGYLESRRFETIIHYFGTDSYKRTPWETYEKNFSSNRKP